MCGIVGSFGGIRKKDLLFYWDMLSHRGLDSYGVIVKTQDKIIAAKSLWDDKAIKNINLQVADWIIAHNRKSSIGGISIDLAHPISNKTTLVIHNGTNRNLYMSVKSAKSDTHAIALIFNKLKRKKDIFDFLNDIGVVWIIDENERRIYFHKDKSRTLYYCIERNLFASEPIDIGTWQMIDNQEMVLDLDKFEIDFVKNVKLEKKKVELKNIKIGFCSTCGQEKLMEEGVYKCPDCIYRNKKKTTSITKGFRSVYSSSSYKWNNGIYY